MSRDCSKERILRFRMPPGQVMKSRQEFSNSSLSSVHNLSKTLRRQSRSLTTTATSLSTQNQSLQNPSRAPTRPEEHISSSRRFQRHLPPAVTVDHLDKISVLSALDDFDYFCSISYSPNNSMNPDFTSSSSSPCTEDVTKHRRERMKGLRTNSMWYPCEAVEDPVGVCSVVDSNATPRRRYHRSSTITPEFKPEWLDDADNSSVSLTSPIKMPITPQAPPPLNQLCVRETERCGYELPLGVAISVEALAADDPDLVEFKVQVVGSPGVGKTSVCQRLANLNRNRNENDIKDDFSDDCQTFSVRAALDRKVFNVFFTETKIYAESESMNIEIQECVDAYLVVYAIDDAMTFKFAKRILVALRDSILKHSLAPAGFILVANKFDLVRGRQVSKEVCVDAFEKLIALKKKKKKKKQKNKKDVFTGRDIAMDRKGSQFAASTNAKFIEISACLDHLIPELLLSVITHLGELEGARDPGHRKPACGERWSNNKKIAVQDKSSPERKSGSSASTAAASLGIEGHFDNTTSSSKTKGPLTKFFKKHF